MNYMEQVAEMLGVEMGERFKMRSVVDDIVFYDDYWFTDEGVMRDGFIVPNLNILTMILTGEFEIVKKAWKPEESGRYYIIQPDGEVDYMINDNLAEDYAMQLMGNCFRTYEDAEAHKDEVMAKFKAVME